MKILIVTDIHSDYEVAESLLYLENPDYVLDCGDHEEIKNLFGNVPHFYIHGNHEPTNIYCDKESLPLPHKIASGQIIHLKNENSIIRIAGLDGNYAPFVKPLSVNIGQINNLGEISEKGIDVLLTHESPLNVTDSQYTYLAEEVIDEIDRIKPRYVFSGHGGGYKEIYTPGGVINIVLEEIVKGYGILDENLNFKWNILRFR